MSPGKLFVSAFWLKGSFGENNNMIIIAITIILQNVIQNDFKSH